MSPEQSADYILGYTCGNDLTSVNIHDRDHHLARSKALDQFCPLGPTLVTDLDTSNLEISSFINGERTQHNYTGDRILNDFETIAMVSNYITLNPGDVILTGTPVGAMESVVKPGDTMDIDIEGIGRLSNRIVK